jgi:hypothetical protein
LKSYNTRGYKTSDARQDYLKIPILNICHVKLADSERSLESISYKNY